MRLQVADRSEYVFLKGRVIEISLAETRRAAESAKIDCQDLKSCGTRVLAWTRQLSLLNLSPASGHNRTAALTIEVGANSPPSSARNEMFCCADAVATASVMSEAFIMNI
jgi:hypothetical protein